MTKMFPFKKTTQANNPKTSRSKSFYAAMLLTVAAAGFGTWGALRTNLGENLLRSGDATIQSTINWGDYVTRPAEIEIPAEDVAANKTNVPDPRVTTAAATTAKDPAKQPYTGDFMLPFGTNISKDYSGGEMVKSLTMGDWRVHDGVDFGGERDAQVFAIASGVVKDVLNDPLWGIVLVIDHGEGIVARYCGLSENSTPQKGREVAKGDAIAVIGQIPCESAEGTHLHLSIQVGGKTADPLAVMNKAG
jgi:murein DD-endopeptidase MepM/ murein hydrolase activator NlpD